MVILSPMEVDEIMRVIHIEKLITINGIREALARRHNVRARAAGAADEQKQAGRHDITPYWRTLRTGGVINLKSRARAGGGGKGQNELLEKERHKVVMKGKRYTVVDY